MTDRRGIAQLFWAAPLPRAIKLLHCAKQLLANECLFWPDYMCLHAEIGIFELGILLHDLCHNTGLRANQMNEKGRRTSCAFHEVMQRADRNIRFTIDNQFKWQLWQIFQSWPVQWLSSNKLLRHWLVNWLFLRCRVCWLPEMCRISTWACQKMQVVL